jgi:hypothetical protein
VWVQRARVGEDRLMIEHVILIRGESENLKQQWAGVFADESGVSIWSVWFMPVSGMAYL